MNLKTTRFAFAATVAAVLSIFSAQADAPVYVRVALVMGNAAYTSAPKLANPGNDAKAMGQTLRSQGFNVIEVVNGSKVQMQSGIAKIRDTLRGQAGIGMLYYAGHGLQLNDHNFMVPVEAKLNKADDIPKEAVDVSEAITAFKTAGNRMNIIVLDACRDNPFGKSSQLKGLAPIDAPVGTFLAYATSPGNVAEDGDEKSANGLYTSFLLQEMKKPNARIEDVFKRVRYLVRQKSDGRQVPWESTSLEEDFVFSDGKIVPPSKFTAETGQIAYETELAEWKQIGSSRNVSDFYAFLQKYPNSALTLAAQGRIDDLAKTKLIVQGGGADGGNSPLSIRPFKAGQHWANRMTIVIDNKTTISESKSRVMDCDVEGCNVEVKIQSADFQQHLIMRWSPSGGILSNTIALPSNPAENQINTLNVPRYLVPPGLLQIGQRWKIADMLSMRGGFTGQLINTGEGRVMRRVPITTAAGTFDSFQVEIDTKEEKIDSNNNRVFNREVNNVAYISPALPTPIKTIRTSRGEGAITSTTNELVFYAEK